jgi:class 3 adenylate cyclase
MFSGLVGSTALSARMDPEDLREVISAYQKCVAETVRRLGGFVAKYSARATGAAWRCATLGCGTPSSQRVVPEL